MHSMVGSSADVMNSTTFFTYPFSSKSLLKERAVSMVTSMALNTILRFSEE